MPAAIIMNGSTEEEKAGYATVGNLVEMSQNEQLGNPAVIVIGEVVRWARNSQYFEQIAALNKAS